MTKLRSFLAPLAGLLIAGLGILFAWLGQFLLYGFGELSSDADTASLILTLFSSAVYVILVIFFEKKYGWYDAEKRS